MKLLLPIVLAIALTGPTYAQDAEKLSAATEYLTTPGTQKMLDEMFSVEGVLGQMGMEVSDLTPDQMKAVEAVIAEETKKSRPSIEEAFATGMSEVLSLSEIVALTDFQSTDYGASAFAKMDPFFTSTMQRFAPSAEPMQEFLFSRIREILGG